MPPLLRAARSPLLRLLAVRTAALAVVLAGVLAGELALVVLGSAVGGLAELLLQRAPREPGAVSGALRAELHATMTADLLLLVAYVLRDPAGSRRTGAIVLVAVTLQQLLRAGHAGLQLVEERLRTRPVEARGLPGAPDALPARSALLQAPAALVVELSGLVLTAGLAVALLTGSRALVAPAAVAAALVALLVVLGGAADVARLARVPRGARLLRQAEQAVAAYAPQVVLYSSGGPGDLHCVNGWLRTLEALEQRTLILLRSAEALAELPATPLPALCVVGPRELMALRMPSVAVALYVLNSPGNVELLRDPRVRSAFIFHGDSDKSVSANPVGKVYDELWVAGEIARQRYLQADVGVREEAIKLVGRPQVRDVRQGRPLEPGSPCRVLYAPTWEGLYGDPYESSLVHSGRDIVRELLATDGVQVVYRPHPKSGRRDPAFAQAHREIVQLLEQAGPAHRVDRPGSDIYETFNDVDVLVADVSGVVSDFLASGKPYFVVDGRALPPEQFRAVTPSAGGAYLVGPGGSGLREGLAAARGADPMRAPRLEVRTQLIGPPDLDPLAAFSDAIDALSRRRRRAAAGVPS